MERAKTVKIIISLVLVTGFTVAGIYDYNRGKGKRVVYSHRTDHHPVINALFARKIKQGQPAGDLLNSYPPSRFYSHDNFMTLFYVKNEGESDPCCGGYSIYIRITAMDDKLVKGIAVEGVLSEIEYVFFNKLNEVAEDEYWASRLQYITAIE